MSDFFLEVKFMIDINLYYEYHPPPHSYKHFAYNDLENQSILN